MNPYVAVLLIGAIAVSGYYFISYQYVALHENAHKSATLNYGCVNETINIDFDIDGYSGSYHCDEFKDNLTQNEYDKLREYHSYNEIIGYNVHSLATAIFAGFVLLSLTILVSKGVEA